MNVLGQKAPPYDTTVTPSTIWWATQCEHVLPVEHGQGVIQNAAQVSYILPVYNIIIIPLH